MSRAKSIKLKCHECSGDRKEIRNCEFSQCPLWVFRNGRQVESAYDDMNVRYTRSMAVKKYCLWCMGNDLESVKSCIDEKCPFFEFSHRKVQTGVLSNGHA